MASSTNRGPTNHQPVTYLGPEKSILRRTSETSESFRGSAKNPIINRLQMHETWIIHELYMDYKWLYMDYISVMDETPLIQWFRLGISSAWLSSNSGRTRSKVREGPGKTTLFLGG